MNLISYAPLVLRDSSQTALFLVTRLGQFYLQPYALRAWAHSNQVRVAYLAAFRKLNVKRRLMDHMGNGLWE
jgi:hypothetical protein